MSEVVPMPEPATDPTAEGRLRIVLVSRELLIQVLNLPRGSEVVDLSRDAYFDQHCFALKLAHPDFPPVPPGTPVPHANPLYETRTVDGEPEPHFVGWGL